MGNDVPELINATLRPPETSHGVSGRGDGRHGVHVRECPHFWFGAFLRDDAGGVTAPRICGGQYGRLALWKAVMWRGSPT